MNRDRTVSRVPEDAKSWANSEYVAMSAVVRQGCSEAQLVCTAAHDATRHMNREHGQHAILARREIEDRIRSVGSEADWCHEGRGRSCLPRGSRGGRMSNQTFRD